MAKLFNYKTITVLLLLLLSINLNIKAQKTTIEDYNRAVSFLWENIDNKQAFNLHVTPNWFKDNTGFWYVLHNEKGKEFKKVVFKGQNITPLFNHKKMAESLNTLLDKNYSPKKLPFKTIKYIDKNTLEFSIEETALQLNLNSYKIIKKEEVTKKENPFESKSPDKKWIAFSKNYNLFLKSTETGKETQLSFDGEFNYEYASYYGWYDIMEGENGKRPKNFYVNWSPDSKFLATSIADFRTAEKMYLLDYSIDSLFKPKLLSYYRGSPGDTTMVHIKPVIFNVEKKTEIKTSLPANTHINAVNLTWGENEGELYADYSERGYQKLHLLKLDLINNTSENLISEVSETNIDQFNYKLIKGTEYLIFTSERSGWNQLYSFNTKTKEISSLTNGSYFVNTIKYIDEKKKEIYFLASGKEKGSNPYHQFLYKTTLKGKVSLLTPENAHHIIDIPKNGTYFVDNYSTATIPTKTALRDLKSGKIIKSISEATIEQLLAKNWKAPQIFEAIGRDGKTPIYGALWKPSNFDETKKYPIIDHSYTGPHTQMFPKDFRRVLSLNNQALAELGFIVMMVDGLGTTGRSKKFRNTSYKNMGKNLTDHKLAIEQLAKKYSWIDSDKVGIFGHSAGGYDAAHALLEFPDFYKVAVSSSADHDFRMEKAWWPEMYMGWPVDESYHEVSNITMAGNLKGKLLLVHGGIDDNVNPSATFKLAEAFIKNDKEFDLLIMPSQRHGYKGKYSKYFVKKRWNYFVENLLNTTPIWDFKWE